MLQNLVQGVFWKLKIQFGGSGNGFTWRQGATLDEVVAKAEAKEAQNGGNIITTDRSSKMQRWQDIIDTEIDEEDDDIGCLTCSL